MDIDKLAEAIMGRIEHDRAIHKSSLVEEIQKAMKAPWSATPPMPNMVDLNRLHAEAAHLVNHYDLSDFRMTTTTSLWDGVECKNSEITGQYDLVFDADGTIKIVKIGA